MVEFKVPAIFGDVLYLERLHDINCQNIPKVTETYGSLSTSCIGNARTSSHLPQITINDIKDYIEKSESLGIGFNYVINSSWSNGLEFTKEGKQKIIEELHILEDIGVKNVTICSIGILQIVKKYFPAFSITLSTNLYISSLHELQRWEKEGIKKIVVNRHVNRDYDLLKSMSCSPIQLELLVNSMCNLYCSLRYYHNLVNCTQSNETSPRWSTYCPQSICTKYNLQNPIEMLCCAWIRPEDIEFYNKTYNIQHYKLDGRSLDANQIILIIESYLRGKHEGNFFDLFDFFNTQNKRGISFYLDNRELDGFISKTAKTPCRLCGGGNPICQAVAQKIKICDEKRAKVYAAMLNRTIEGEF